MSERTAEEQQLIAKPSAPGSQCTLRCCCCYLSLVALLLAGLLTICALIPIKNQISDDFVAQYLGGDPSYGWWRMPANQSSTKLSEIREQLFNRSAFPATYTVPYPSNMSIGYAYAEDAIRFMYEATRVEDVWEKMPEVFRGVFWMKGNGVAEELTVLQYGQWFEEDQIMLVPMAPFTWAWPGGIPEHAPFSGALYSKNVTFTAARVLLQEGTPAEPPVSYSYDFGDSNLKHASLQAHRGSDLRVDIVNFKALLPILPDIAKYGTGEFTLSEENPSGDEWRRGIKWGVGSCRCIPFGSYDLVKVMKGSGEPNEPYYSEFLEYMGKIPLFFWTGFVNNSSGGESP